MGRDRAADLVGGESRALLVGLRQHDREMRRSFRVQEGDGVGVADGLPQAFRDLAQQSLDLDVFELLVDVLGMVELDHEHR